VIVDRANALISQLFDLLIRPVASFGPGWTMLYLSAITGIVCVWIFGKTSNQSAIQKVKEHIGGNLIGVRLFQDDLGVVLRLHGKLLKLTFRYMAYSVIPMLFMFLPVTIILIQMNEWYESRALEVGETALLKVKVNDPAILDKLSLQTSQGVAIDSPAVRIPADKEAVWRLKAASPGAHQLQLNAGEETLTKDAIVDGKWARVASLRSTSIEDRILNPGEPGVPSRLGVQSVELQYPDRTLEYLGIGWHWLVWFFVFSMIFGFAVKDFLGVKI
jgi:uncharacterized membrane protein (DUF106 family)